MTPYVCTGGEAAYPVELLNQDGGVITCILSSACHADWLVLNYREFDMFPAVERMTWRYRSDAQLDVEVPNDDPGTGPGEAEAGSQ